MPVALTADQTALAEAVSGFADRHSTREYTRANTDRLAAGELPSCWADLVALGLPGVHLPEEVGGQGGTLDEIAVVLAEAGRALLPGPLLPSVLTSTIVASSKSGAPVEDALRRFAAGGTGATIAPDHGVRAADTGLTGATGPVLGAASAEVFLVAAGTRWFLVERATEGVRVEARAGSDLGRDLGVVRLQDVAATELDGIDAEYAEAVATAFMAAEAAGVIRWCSDTATEYVKARKQFGRPVGAFQAVQHRTAQLLITSELATSAAWDAVRGLADDAAQRTHAVAGAAIITLGRAVHAAVECLGLHGAIGFTWEHDLHLYWRRAISLAGLGGSAEYWERRLGEVALDGPRNFAVPLPETDSTFRDWVSEILDRAAALDNPNPSKIGDHDSANTGPRRTLLADAGLVSPPMPKPWGIEAGPLEQLILQDEYDRHGIAQPGMGIGQWVVPIVLQRGTPEQLARLAAPALRGEEIWCQLMSEPEAGSDVASLSLRATRDGGGWRLNGQKIWTTLAHRSDWGLLLARTDSEAERHRGLTMFLVDMHGEGVTVRPITQSSGNAEFNEVFFDDAYVPDDMVLGEVGQGWALTLETLAQERLFIGGVRDPGHNARLVGIVEREEYAGSRENALRALGRISARGAAISAMNLRETIRRLDGHGIGPATSISKAAASMLHTDAAAAALELIGPAAALNEQDSEVVQHELDIPTWVIGGGTLEIQLNTIATFVMGLPRK
ncbi:acyl-CoA dehydrogenase [Nocardia macrotermitis]|uniref:Acyl-CoA dehydrogenase FadE34 n=1 Tax=Nocardia macrotermitis TaxID=2585198 RepID=A0A7K0DA92_9NOCA|nr:acyl-CoA dehydrogenase [Nocardia macrotermitis]MQY22529.1 Acyl-CoA dehydrogenase FadE34 [Nocardia macrotermitis]